MHAERIARNLRQHTIESMVTGHIAVAAARNHRALRARGITLRTMIDLLIGTFCMERRHRLLHDDRDFDSMKALPGLAVVR